VSWAFDSALPRDKVVVTPCYRWANFTVQNAESLANNVLDAFETTFGAGKFPETVAKVYDLEGSKPVLPMATVTRYPGVVKGTGQPREVALCLSFSGGQHQPRQRGRLYIPAVLPGGGTGLRPSGGAMVATQALGQALYDVGGANVDWIVWSRVNKSATGITRCWVDDEWDTVRTRGLRPTTRNLTNF
jgi:hypothetical protein